MPATSRAPRSYSIDQEIDWGAQWVEVALRVELPFWLMTDNVVVSVEEGGHSFPVSINGETFELQAGEISDAKFNSIYVGPKEQLSEETKKLLDERPEISLLWRKCKTNLRITSRCNEHVIDRELARYGPNDRDQRPAEHSDRNIYLQELCRLHIPVINKLIQTYRLATYDYFAFEVAPWDVPVWRVERDGRSVQCLLVPYRGWDYRPMVAQGDSAEPPMFYKLIGGEQLQHEIKTVGTSGESEVLDALNLMERGDYSGAVRRITTAIEVAVEAVVQREIERAAGKAAAAKFLRSTRANFAGRIHKYEALSGRSLADGVRKNLEATRQLRHRIVHRGYRIPAPDRGRAQMAVDTGRWIFNWFENDEGRCRVREQRIAFRSIGRDLSYGIFSGKITPDGVSLSSFSSGLKAREDDR